MAGINVYSREGRAFVVATRSGFGRTWEGDTIHVIDLNVEAIANAIDRALAESESMSPEPPDPKRRWAMLKAAGVRGIRKFYEGARLVSAYFDAKGFRLLRWKPARDGRGLEPDGDEQVLAGPRHLREIAECVLRVLTDS